MNTGDDIEIQLRLCGMDEFPAEFLLDTIKHVNHAVYLSEVSDLRMCRNRLSDLPSVAFDAAEHRIRQYRGSAVRIHSIEKGSLALTAVVAGLGYFILKNTLGETLKEAWLNSDMHLKLVKLLTKSRWTKVADIVDRTEMLLGKNLPGDVRIKFTTPTANDIENESCRESASTIQIDIELKPTKPFPDRRSKEFHSK